MNNTFIDEFFVACAGAIITSLLGYVALMVSKNRENAERSIADMAELKTTVHSIDNRLGKVEDYCRHQ